MGCGSSVGGSLASAREARQPNLEVRAGRAIDEPGAAAVAPRHVSDQRQAEAVPGEAPLDGKRRPNEGLKDARPLIGAHADSIVIDEQHDLAAGFEYGDLD